MTHAFPIFLKLKLRTIFSVVTTGTGRSTHRAQRTSVSTRGDVSLPWAVVEFTRYVGTPIFRWLAKITTGLSKCRQVITVRSPAHVVCRAARRRRSVKIQNHHDVEHRSLHVHRGRRRLQLRLINHHVASACAYRLAGETNVAGGFWKPMPFAWGYRFEVFLTT